MRKLVRIGALALVLVPSLGAADPGTAEWSALQGLAVSSLEITGISSESRDALRPGLALTGQRRGLRREPALFFSETLEADCARARLFLARRGHPWADVEPEVRRSGDRRSVRVILRITPGAAVRIADVRFEGFDPAVEGLSVPPLVGEIFSDETVRSAAGDLAARLRGAGYAFAAVEARPVARNDSSRVDVVFDVRAGARVRFAEVEVEGVPPDLASLARATVDVRPGQSYAPSVLRAAETNLRDLGLFRVVQIEPEPAADDRLLVRLRLAPRASRTRSLGVGWFSEDLLRVDASWRHRNLFRSGRGLRVEGSFSRFLQTVRSDVIWPRLAGTATRGTAGIAVRREDEETYGLWDTRVDFNARRRIGRRTWVGTGLAVSYVVVDVRASAPDDLDDPEGMITSVPLTWTRDTSDDPVYPTRGAASRFRGEIAPPGLGSVAEWTRGEFQISGYRSPFGRMVLAGRALIGVARPLGDSPTVLASRRLFAGGSRSMRGYGRRRLGPRDESGDPIGGEAKVEVSLECRFPLLGRVEGAAFLDGGQVWGDRAALRLGDLAWAAGPALMVRTPIGPLRLDAGYLLDPVPGEPEMVLHFSVGHPY